MKGIAPLILGLAVALAVAGLPFTTTAQDSPEIVYDIFQQDDCLAVLIDLTPFITARAVEHLEDGVDLLLHCQFNLEIPRRFWGSRKVAEEALILKVSYGPLTEEFLLDNSTEEGSEPRHFLSLAALYGHLRDSVTCCLAVIDSLDDRDRHQVAFKVTTVFLTDLNPAAIDESEEDDGSPVGFLFRQFLNITGFGRREFSTVSRPFSLSELESVPARP